MIGAVNGFQEMLLRQKLRNRALKHQLLKLSRLELQEHFGKFGAELFDLCRGIDDRSVEPDRPRKSLSTEQTFAADLETIDQCQEKLEEAELKIQKLEKNAAGEPALKPFENSNLDE